MDIEELNQQMSFFQNEYSLSALQTQQQNQTQNQNQSINFPQPLDAPLPTTQIKRPTRTTGEHRNEINDKMVQMKMNQPMMVAPNQFQAVGAVLTQSTRNKSQYQNTSSDALEQNNPLSSYFQQNYNTLNGNNQFIPSLEQHNQQPHLQPGNGYHKIDEKRIDYRQNMNSAVGNFIFDNPNAAKYNPQQVAHNPNGNSRDTRMVIQDSSKDIYRNEANSRMAQYSPLARASHVPINIANMSVNDFYANINPNTRENQLRQYQTTEEDTRTILNTRINAYTPLSKTAPLENNNSWQDNNVNRANPLVTHDKLPIISNSQTGIYPL